VVAAALLDRTAFTTSRALDFFGASELTRQIGHPSELWPLALLKELLDNALDACEGAGVAPDIVVTIEPDYLTVQDNGPGLPAAVLERSLDYLVRVSDKRYYVSPTRGQLGNALKCLWAAPFVAGHEQGGVEVSAGGVTHRVRTALDIITREPKPSHMMTNDGLVRNGTRIRLHWPGIAGYLADAEPGAFYNVDATLLLAGFATLNPHASLTLLRDHDGRAGTRRWRWPPTCPGWRKWQPNDPTSPHWYDVEGLRALIAAYLAEERRGAKARTVREFLAEFRGLAGSARQKAITDQLDLTGAALHDLVRGDDGDPARVRTLLDAMRRQARPVAPEALGSVGEQHLLGRLVEVYGAANARYKKVAGTTDGLPYVLEVAFGIAGDLSARDRLLLVGRNWSPLLRAPAELATLLGQQRVDPHDPVIVVVHLACPRLEHTDAGKTALILPPELRAVLARALAGATAEWKRTKRQADRADRVREEDLARLRRERQAPLSIKAAAFAVMADAYRLASANGSLPANTRQVMYAARPRVLELTGGTCWSDANYFTQHLLPDYLSEHPEATASWDVVFDARGHLYEPHTGHEVPLGTLAVRRYLADWRDAPDSALDATTLPTLLPTRGPAQRYRFALFVEKEGFLPLFHAARLAERYDLAIMSTKGVSVTASRLLLERLSRAGVTILVLHDFDKTGFTIAHTLRSDTRRYAFATTPRVVDLGLRLADVRAMGLQSEPVDYDSTVDPRRNLRACGATEDEANFLVQPRRGCWTGQRVELNAMTSDQFLRWLTEKLEEVGAEKVTPDAATLEAAYRRAVRVAAVERAIDAAIAASRDMEVAVPANLEGRVRAAIAGTEDPWDAAIWELARERGGA